MKSLKKIPLGLIVLSLFLLKCGDGNSKNLTESNVDSANKAQTNSRQNSGTNPISIRLPVDTANVQNVLINLIKQEQRCVRDSWGIYANQCFTDNDLKTFKDTGTTRQIVIQLRADNNFSAIILALKGKSAEEREAILNSASATYRKPWAMLGLDPQTRTKEELLTGQTEAGSEAEKSIADAVVGLIRELLNKKISN